VVYLQLDTWAFFLFLFFLFGGMKPMPEETTKEKVEKILHMDSWKGIAP